MKRQIHELSEINSLSYYSIKDSKNNNLEKRLKTISLSEGIKDCKFLSLDNQHFKVFYGSLENYVQRQTCNKYKDKE